MVGIQLDRRSLLAFEIVDERDQKLLSRMIKISCQIHFKLNQILYWISLMSVKSQSQSPHRETNPVIHQQFSLVILMIEI
jgi:hypothetical protein